MRKPAERPSDNALLRVTFVRCWLRGGLRRVVDLEGVPGLVRGGGVGVGDLADDEDGVLFREEFDRLNVVSLQKER